MVIDALNAPTDASRVASTRPRLAFIDGMRALAALYVVFSHAWSEQNNGHFASHWLRLVPTWSAHFAVGVFIVLSGYCLILPIARKRDQIGSLSEFFRRRAMRILPPYYITLVLSILVIATVAGQRTGSIWDINLPLKLDTVLAHLLLIHDLPLHLQGGMINYPLWSIAVEFQIYLLMPLIALSLRVVGNVRTLLWTMSLGLLHFALHGRIDSMVPWYVGLFTMGAIAARWCVQRPARIDPLIAYAAWGLIALTVLVSLKKGDLFMVSHFYIFDTVIGAATAILLCTSYADAASKSNVLTRFLSWRPLEEIGIFSYSLYLIHAPLLHLFHLLLGRFFRVGEGTMLALLLLSIPAIVGLSRLFYLVGEKPFMAKRADVALKPQNVS
jgi:peptidoglycan/LPS O-acetylase OafA/YrhL